MNKIRSRWCDKVSFLERRDLKTLLAHDVSVFAVESLDQPNRHGVIVTGKYSHGLHLTEIQAVLCNIYHSIIRVVTTAKVMNSRHIGIVHSKTFVVAFLIRKTT